MSVESISRALKVKGLTSTQKLVLIGIANHDGDGGAWPSIATLAEYVDASERTVQRAIRDLEDAGLLTIDAQAGGTMATRPDRRPNRYVLHLDGVTPMSPREDERGDIQRADGVTSGAQRGDTAMSPEPSMNRPYEPSITPLPPAERGASLDPLGDLEFEAFWATYPRRVGKPVARRAFKGALKKATAEQIAGGLAAWCAFWAQDGRPEYIPHPSTWLNQERWNDDPPPPRATATRGGRTMDVLTRLAEGNL